jgi:hypothetical protein
MSIKNSMIKMVAVLALVSPLAVSAAEQQTFASPEAAVNALVAALKGNDESALVAIVGESHKNLVITGDRTADAAVRAAAAAQLAAFHALEERGGDRRVLLMGVQAWPVPIPLVREGATWRFATEEGAEELINRRIGRNERSAINVLRAYLGAQHEYASIDRDADGVLQYANRLASTPGKQDGLYWPADAAKGEAESPFGPLIAESSAYLSGKGQGDPYRGYHFRILTRQGANAAGGAYDYVINGRLIAGFAMVAYPAVYGETGVMSFIVNHNGRVYERDLGADSVGFAGKMSSFDPGSGWAVVAP